VKDLHGKTDTFISHFEYIIDSGGAAKKTSSIQGVLHNLLDTGFIQEAFPWKQGAFYKNMAQICARLAKSEFYTTEFGTWQIPNLL
jgi:hypothetical protein